MIAHNNILVFLGILYFCEASPAELRFVQPFGQRDVQVVDLPSGKTRMVEFPIQVTHIGSGGYVVGNHVGSGTRRLGVTVPVSTFEYLDVRSRVGGTTTVIGLLTKKWTLVGERGLIVAIGTLNNPNGNISGLFLIGEREPDSPHLILEVPDEAHLTDISAFGCDQTGKTFMINKSGDVQLYDRTGGFKLLGKGVDAGLNVSGTQIAYRDESGDVVVVGVTSGIKKNFGRSVPGHPLRWSADGKLILFHRRHWLDIFRDGAFRELVVVNVETGSDVYSKMLIGGFYLGENIVMTELSY